MKFSKPIGKYASILTVSLLVGTGAAPALADDAGYLETTPTRDRHVATSTPALTTRDRAELNPNLFQITTPTRDRHVAMSTPAQTRDLVGQNPTPSEELWAHFQAYADSGM